MWDRRGAWAAKSCGALALVMALVGLAVVQAAAPRSSRSGRRGRRGARSATRAACPLPKEKAKPNAADPLGKAGPPPAPLVPGTYHFNFRLHSFDGAPLAASYYRSKLGSTAPVVMLDPRVGPVAQGLRGPGARAQGPGPGRAPPGARLRRAQPGPPRPGPEPAPRPDPRRTHRASSRTSRPPTSSWSTATTGAS